MKDTIIFAPGLSGTEILRSLARFGQNTFGYRIVNAVDLSRMAFMKNGIALTETFLPRKDEPAVIDSFLREILYFESASYADAEAMASALYMLRSLITEAEPETIRSRLPLGEFSGKNAALVSVYERYMEKLAAKERIDTVGIIRKALEETKDSSFEILTLKEYPLTPLERKLADHLSSGSAREFSLTDLFHAEPKPLSGVTISECYGASNEVRDIISYICQNNIPLDRCTVAIAETLKYAEHFEDISEEYGLPITFGCGLPITVSNPARILKLYQKWNISGFRGIEALSALIMSNAFDRKALAEAISPGRPISRDEWKAVIETSGSLRLSADAVDNRVKLEKYKELVHSTDYKKEKDRQVALFVLSCLGPLSNELEKGAAHLVSSYAKIRDGRAGRADRSAVTVITGLIAAWQQYSGKEDISQIIPATLNKTVSSESSREGCLHVCGISGAMAVPREYLFVAGLSASNYPGSPTENYLLLDSDLLLFGGREQVPASDERIIRKKQSFMDLLNEASALDLKVRLSYSSYNLADLKDENPSSVLQEVFHQIYPKETAEDAFRNACRHVSFFEDRISRHSSVGKAYIRGDSILLSDSDSSTPTSSQTYSLADRSWSPSSIDVFFNCPKKFYLTRVLGIEEPEPDDPFEVIDAKETGTLAHSLMELLGKQCLSEDEFVIKAGEAFDRFLDSRPPMHPDDAEKEKKTFLRMMRNAWQQDPKREAFSSEEKKEITHQPSGVRLLGIPDRVEKTEDGKYLIVDFKTGRRISHRQDDIGTCLQVLIYAYMMEQGGLDIAGCEYRYLRRKQTVPCRYDTEMKDKLNGRLTEFRDALSAGDFPCMPSDDTCRFCKLDKICGKDREPGEEGDGDE